MSEPSERMQHLIAALEASTIAGHDMHVHALKAAIAEIEQRAEKAEREESQLRAEIGSAFREHGLAAGPEALHGLVRDRDALRTRLQGMTRCDHHSPAKSVAICCPDCFAEIRTERDKWKRAAVALERCNQVTATYNRAQIRGELLNACEDAWTKADLEFAGAIAELGNEWTEAVK